MRVQLRDPEIQSDLGWREAGSDVVEVRAEKDGRVDAQPDLAIWLGSVAFKQTPEPSQYRLLIEEYEYISATYSIMEGNVARPPGRLIYAETIDLDDALVSEV